MVGSGVTGAEFVHAYTELGVDVTVVASRDQILPYEDADAALVLEEIVRRTRRRAGQERPGRLGDPHRLPGCW